MSIDPSAAFWAVIPVKAFHLGKSRLNLPDPMRMQVNIAFLRHVLATAVAVLPAHNLVIVSRDDRVLALAGRAGAHILRENEQGDLNDALAEGARFAADRGAVAVLSLFSDLPDIEPSDIQAMMDAFAPHRIVLAPDESGTGTNAMLMAPNRLPYQHGTGSFSRHLDAARDAGLEPLVVRREGLMRDIDTPDQWLAMTRAGSTPEALHGG